MAGCWSPTALTRRVPWSVRLNCLMVRHVPLRHLAAKYSMVCHAYTNRNSNSYTYAFTYGFTNGDAYAPNADSNCDSDSHTDCNADSNCNSLSKSDTNAKRDDSTGANDANPSGSAYPSTAPITSAMKKKHTAQSGFFNLFARICMAVVCAGAISAHANIITVTNRNDSGPGSLRQALTDASDGDLINFAVTGTIVLTSGGLVIDKSVTISGPGPDRLSIDGNQAGLECVFGLAVSHTVTISGLTVTNGVCGIYSDHASLTVTDCVVTANKGHSSLGGIGINNARGPTAPLEHRNDCDVHEAFGERPAGGFATLTIANCVISDNFGSGVENLSARVTIIDSTISGNFADNSQGRFGEGGGIYTGGAKFPGNLTVINSTISGNFAFSDGGGIVSGFSVVTIVNSTISGNSTGDPDNGYGGGIAADGGGVVTARSDHYEQHRERQLSCDLRWCLRRHSRNQKHNPERERVRKHRWHCHFARLQHQQRRRRRSFERPRRSDQHRPAAWSVAESRWTDAHAYADAGQPCH